MCSNIHTVGKKKDDQELEYSIFYFVLFVSQRYAVVIRFGFTNMVVVALIVTGVILLRRGQKNKAWEEVPLS